MKVITNDSKNFTGIVILNYNNYLDTINCFQSILNQRSRNHLHIVIVDNYSQNDSITQIINYFSQNNLELHVVNENEINNFPSSFTLIKATKNFGYAGGNNIGIHFLLKTNIDNILILNNDILFKEDIISPMIESLNNHPGIGLISPLLVKPDGTIDYNCCRYNPSNKIFFTESLKFLKLPFFNKENSKKYLFKTKPELLQQEIVTCDIVSGACILAKKTTWELLNGFDPNTFLYYEENILFEKLKNKNLKSAILTTVRAIHLGAKSTKQIKNTFLLKTELKSLTYYLKTYRKSNPVFISSIILIRKIQILLVGLNNRLKNKS